MRRLVTILTVLGAVLVGTAGVALAGAPAPAFYVDGEAYATVGTPTDFSHTGAPDHSFDTIYALGEQMNVAEAAPGDHDYNGGRWMVQAVDFSDYQGALADPLVDTNDNDVLDSAEEVLAAVEHGHAELGEILTTFECPVIPIRGANAR